MTPLSRDILDFWFGPKPRVSRAEWFRKDADFDAAIRARFGSVLDAALSADPRPIPGNVDDALAHVVLLDQFPRNVFRDTPRAFAGDAQALATAIAVVDAGQDAARDPVERTFLYLPFEHAEDRGMQQRSIALYTKLETDTGDSSSLEWAQKHASIIERFGRYPHRNAILGRVSTPEELAFLREPGSRF